MDNVGIVLEDLDAAIAFFSELGLKLEGRMPIEAPWADQVVGIDGMRSEIAMMRMPDGNGGIELTKFHRPKAITPQPKIAPPNTLGGYRMMFLVDDIDETVARLKKKHGASVVGEIARYEDEYRLCYLRGPEGIIVALSEEAH